MKEYAQPFQIKQCRWPTRIASTDRSTRYNRNSNNSHKILGDATKERRSEVVALLVHEHEEPLEIPTGEARSVLRRFTPTDSIHCVRCHRKAMDVVYRGLSVGCPLMTIGPDFRARSRLEHILLTLWHIPRGARDAERYVVMGSSKMEDGVVDMDRNPGTTFLLA